MSAEYRVEGGIAFITLNNPPLNGLGFATRCAVMQGLKQALLDGSVTAIVILGAGKVFSAGADIKEFNTPQALAEPGLHGLIDAIESAEKPVLAAIHGCCMGGGLELALACHYRMCAPGALIALPEVKLGLLPGAGGTQRLPRLLGIERALDMILSGAQLPVEQLAMTPLFDHMMLPGADLQTGALVFAQQIARLRPLPKVSKRAVDDAAKTATASLAAARAREMAKAAPLLAPIKCIDAVAAALVLPFQAGLAFERDLFMQLLGSAQSKALRHAFFAERAATKVPGLAPETPTRSIVCAAVIGAGTMGAGIAMTFANAGIGVMLLETRQDLLDQGLARIARNYASTLQKGKLTPAQCEQHLALIKGTLSYDDIAKADIVIEAVFEDMQVKQAVFEQLDLVLQAGAILASNTSTLDMNRIAGFTSRAPDVIGMHFFSPAHVMPLLEIVRAGATANDVLATVLGLAKKLKKTAVVAGVCDGFIGNRMLEQYIAQATFLLLEGCLPQQVDHAMEQFGFAMGPWRMLDLAGNDVGWRIRQRRQRERPDLTAGSTMRLTASGLADRLCEMGRLGQKTAAGWYDYAPSSRQPEPSDVVNDLILKHSLEAGIARRAIGADEIVERLVYALVNEGAKILAEGIALRASDIDLVYLAGYGFPRWRGGPMWYADTVGLAQLVSAIEIHARGVHGAAWQLAPRLLELAAEGKTFNP